jgi:hypothetical protein
MYHEYQFNPYYHSPQDIIENMNVNYSTKVSKLMTATLGELAEAQIVNIPPNKPKISGPTEGYEGEKITLYFNATDPDGHDLFYLVDWGDGTNSGWLGPYTSGEIAQRSYIYISPSEYEIKVKAKDIKNKQSDWSDIHNIIILEDFPPEKPTISGPKFARAGDGLEFKFTAIDPEEHDVYYHINWGDGDIEFWLGPYKSGETVIFNHIYTKGGTYKIISKAKDLCGKLGQQNQFTLFVIRNRAVSRLTILEVLEKLLIRFPILDRLLS